MDFIINDFEGPLDLLLHLIKTSKMDIYDISIEMITKQYLDFIKQMEEMNLDIASEYLVMASELIELKSKLFKISIPLTFCQFSLIITALLLIFLIFKSILSKLSLSKF